MTVQQPKARGVIAPLHPRVCLSLAITGHRASHPAYAANRVAIELALAAVMDAISTAHGAATPTFNQPLAPIRLHTLLADGADQAAAKEALARGWTVIAPLPFGLHVNRAINAQPTTPDDASLLLAGNAPLDPDVTRRAAAIDEFYREAQLFQLADDDPEITATFLSMLASPNDRSKADAFRADCAERIALGGRLLAEHSDLLIAIWDGERTSFTGGTGHTVATFLAHGGRVVWIDPKSPDDWRILESPEALATVSRPAEAHDREAELAQLVHNAISIGATATENHQTKSKELAGVEALSAARWRSQSSPVWHAYRRIEALFSGEPKGWRNLKQVYQTPAELADPTTSPALRALHNLPGAKGEFAAKVGDTILARHAWADGISAHLSDCYRGGMVVSFLLSAIAIIGGIAYLPIVDVSWKWPFALVELIVLCTILALTVIGQKRRWHGRWFETRRVAEYLRHGPILLALGSARAPGRWPVGDQNAWPEFYARHALREAGLPKTVITADYLRSVLQDLLDSHVTVQRDYHAAKARRLTTVHHRLDHLSERLFQLAVFSVGIFLILAGLDAAGLVDHGAFKSAAKAFTFLGVALPTLGGAIAGIRYFGDFERFAAISALTASKLDSVHQRIVLLLQAPDKEMDYGPVSDLAHEADKIVFIEIENWQSVFGAKKTSVPV